MHCLTYVSIFPNLSTLLELSSENKTIHHNPKDTTRRLYIFTLTCKHVGISVLSRLSRDTGQDKPQGMTPVSVFYWRHRNLFLLEPQAASSTMQAPRGNVLLHLTCQSAHDICGLPDERRIKRSTSKLLNCIYWIYKASNISKPELQQVLSKFLFWIKRAKPRG